MPFQAGRHDDRHQAAPITVSYGFQERYVLSSNAREARHIQTIWLLAKVNGVGKSPHRPTRPSPGPSLASVLQAESGGYCAPMSRDAPNAIPKVGQCPSGYYQSGAFCLQMREMNRRFKSSANLKPPGIRR